MPPAKDERIPGDLVELGVIRGAYGLKGWAHVVPHSDEAAALLASRAWWLIDERGAQALDVLGVRRHGDALVAKWNGCETKEAAEALRNARVAVPRAEFPPVGEGEYYAQDLVGAVVVNRAGVELGRVTAVRSNGVQDLLEIGDGDGADARVLLVPMVEDYVDRIDLDARRIEVDWEADW